MPTPMPDERDGSWMFAPWRPTDDPTISVAIADALARSEEAKIPAGRTATLLGETISGNLGRAIEESALRLGKHLRRNEPLMLADHAGLRRNFEYRLQWIWGEALDLLYGIMVCCHEMGEEFNSAHRPVAAAANDHRFEALTLIHARACLTASEVHALLRSGHPFGARARWRTLHELSVIASILGAGDDDLANRFLIHSEVEAYRDAKAHNALCVRTGRTPYSTEEITHLAGIRDAAVAQYGSSFEKPWGWAAPITTPRTPNFALLETHAGLDHLRPDYVTSSHLLHAGSSGASFVRRHFRGGQILLTGPTNAGLAEPIHAAAISLVQITTTLIVNGRDFDYNPIVLSSLQAMLNLTDELGALVLGVSDRVDTMEAAFREAERRGRLALFALLWRSRGHRVAWRLRVLTKRWRARLPRRQH